MIGRMISHYTILDKLGEVAQSPMGVFQRVDATLSPNYIGAPLFGGRIQL